jgi:predicted ribosomally synthesized peptide with nif11-like leader
MSKQNAAQLKARIENDPELAKKVRKSDAATFEALAHSLDLPCTMAELRAVLVEANPELSEDELERVAGGYFFSRESSCSAATTSMATCTKAGPQPATKLCGGFSRG